MDETCIIGTLPNAIVIGIETWLWLDADSNNFYNVSCCRPF